MSQVLPPTMPCMPGMNPMMGFGGMGMGMGMPNMMGRGMGGYPAMNNMMNPYLGMMYMNQMNLMVNYKNCKISY